jgi:hypothetical protein
VLIPQKQYHSTIRVISIEGIIPCAKLKTDCPGFEKGKKKNPKNSSKYIYCQENKRVKN